MPNPAAPTESPQPLHTPQHPLPCPRHLVLIPSYNTGRDLLRRTVAGALRHWQPVWVVVDGSTDGSDDDLESLANDLPCNETNGGGGRESPTNDLPCNQTNGGGGGDRGAALRILRLPRNGGKGRAVQAGMQAALAAGFSHVLCFDADGQHPANAIGAMMALSAAHPLATIMGQPVFGSDAPAERLFGRKIANFFTEWEAGHCGLGDTLFGMRVYRIEPSLAALNATRFGRRFDFDPEIAVRLCWQGVQPLPYAVPCRYLSKEEGGVSHFNYLRDNVFQVFLHLRLLPQYLLWRWPAMRDHKRRWRSQQGATGGTEVI